MKVIFYYDKPLANPLSPRDIRNLVASCLPDGEIKERLMNKRKDSNSQSEYIYPIPSYKNFEILSYKNDREALEEIEKYLVGKTVSIRGNDSKIIKCRLKEEEVYNIPTRGLNVYKTKTPIIVSTNDIEHKIAHNEQKNGNYGAFLKNRIERITTKQMKDIFGVDFNIEDLQINMIDCKVRTITPDRTKPDKYYQGYICKFISNYDLPRFLGYKSGLGYGEIQKASVN